MPMFLLRAVAVWLVMIAAETIHGILRALLVPLVAASLPTKAEIENLLAIAPRYGIEIRIPLTGSHPIPLPADLDIQNYTE